jgi:peroxiredoxin Q/BCP
MRTVALVVLFASGVAVGAAAQQESPYGKPSAIIVSGPEEGARAPDFSLPAASADTSQTPDQFWSLGLQRGKVVVLAFYAKDFTKGCTAEMTSFNEQYDTLFGPDVIVVGINADSLETHRRFAQSLNLRFLLLSDLDQKVSKKFGSADRDRYNRRTVYVIGRAGEVAYRDMQFGAIDPKAYTRLKEAVQSAVKKPAQ